MFITLIVMMFSQIYTNMKTYQIVHFKYVQFISILFQYSCLKSTIRTLEKECVVWVILNRV